MWTEKVRSWRKNKKRAVSPIIATILLVAITVVLAAVLYILISGLTTGPGNKPLGGSFGWGPASNTTGTATTGCPTTSPPTICYSLEIASASGITTSGISFSLRNAAGAAAAFPSTGNISLISAAGKVLTTWTPANGWASGSVSLASGQTIVVNTGSSVLKNGLLGDQLVAVGQGSFQGTVTAQAFA